MNQTINQLSKEVFEQNKLVGWWDDMNRCIFTTLQLVSTEIAEATEGARKNLMDDHLPKYPMESVELADVIIRMMDLGGRCGWEYDNRHANVPSAEQFKKWQPGKVHFWLNKYLVELSNNIQHHAPYDVINDQIEHWYSQLIRAVINYSKSRGWDVIAIAREKLEYNKNRADHKRENRAKIGGKAF